MLRKYQASQTPSSKEPHLARDPWVPDPWVSACWSILIALDVFSLCGKRRVDLKFENTRWRCDAQTFLNGKAFVGKCNVTMTSCIVPGAGSLACVLISICSYYCFTCFCVAFALLRVKFLHFQRFHFYFRWFSFILFVFLWPCINESPTRPGNRFWPNVADIPTCTINFQGKGLALCCRGWEPGRVRKTCWFWWLADGAELAILHHSSSSSNLLIVLTVPALSTCKKCSTKK